MAKRLVPEAQTPRQVVNRAEQIKRKQKEFVSTNEASTTLLDVDGAIMWHMKNKIKPKVVDNGEVVDVPIIWGNTERWNSVQNDGFFRDTKGRIMVPLAMLKRATMTPYEATLHNKLSDELYFNYQKKYSDRNRYDKFSKLYGTYNPLKGEREEYDTYQVRLPDFVTIGYELVLWCEYIEQVNNLTELLVYYGGQTWGDGKEGRPAIVVNATAYSFAEEIGTGTDRLVRSTLTLETIAPLLPKDVSDEIVTKKVHSIRKTNVSFKENIV